MEAIEIHSKPTARNNDINAIKSTLQLFGIDMSARKTPNGPGKWLLRGTSDKSPLFNGKMIPKSGEWGYTGVYCTDNPEKVVIPSEGMIVVMPSEAADDKWVLSPSEEFESLSFEEAQRRGLDRSKIGEGLAAYQAVFEKHPVYQIDKAYATLPKEVDMESATLILVTPRFLESEDLAKIPLNIRHKLVRLNVPKAA